MSAQYKNSNTLPLYAGRNPAGVLSTRQTTRVVVVLGCLLAGLAIFGLHQRQDLITSLSFKSSSAPSDLDAISIPVPLPKDDSTKRKEFADPNNIATWQAPTPELSPDASLSDRLTAWNSTPVSTAANWLRFNFQTCPPSITDVNKLWGFIAPIEIPTGPWSKWWKSPIEVAKVRQEMFNYMLDMEEMGMMNKTYQGEGRGIIVSAGNLDTFYRVATTVRMLRRHLNTNLPVEVFSFPGENAPPAVLEEFAQLGVTWRQLNSLHKDPSRTKNWHIKATAILASSFREVLYLDSDNMPAVPLEGEDSIFESPGFKRTGLMYWPDYWKTVAHNPVWQIIGVQCRNEWEMEAGQVLIDKSRHLDILRLTEYMLLRYKTWFALSDGDKDIFRFATLALRKRWTVPGGFPGSASWGPERPADYCAHTILQRDHLGRPAFVHANMVKKLPWTLPFSNNSKATGIWGYTKMSNITTSEDLDCDHLANTNRFGISIKTPPTPASRRRAALEKGIRSWFRATREYTACIDQRWDDPRTEDEKLIMRYESNMGPGSEPNIAWENPMIEHYWDRDEVLKDFESNFWSVGGKAAGIGFG